jgi:hypothetical protein
MPYVGQKRWHAIIIDPATARIGHSYDPANWKNRWLYHGLHSLDLPWL